MAEAESWPPRLRAQGRDRRQLRALRTRSCTRITGRLRAAFGSHNLRSLAFAITEARRRASPTTATRSSCSTAWPSRCTTRCAGSASRLRVYAPMGELVPGMAYLVRRLLENTSNESFVRHHFAEGRPWTSCSAAAGRGGAARVRRLSRRRAATDPCARPLRAGAARPSGAGPR